MTAQVQTIPINIGLPNDAVSARGNHHTLSVPTNISTSPLDKLSLTFTGFGLGLPSPPPEIDDDDTLPKIRSESVDSLVRAGILEAAVASAANQPNAEAAFFIADLGNIYRQHKRWQECLPNVTPYYAVKANPDTVVLRLLAALGTGFDCASMNEINMVAKLGVNPSRVIFANPCKPTSFVRHAAKMGVDMTTFDNIDELYKISRAHPGAKLVLRILTDDSKSLSRLGLKFGAPLVVVPTLLAKAVELGLNVVGISFHVGSGCYDTGAFTDAVARAKKAFIMGQEAGYHFTLLDVGGGFGSEHFEEFAAVLARALRTHFGDFSGQIIAEPGRFYVADAFTLATNIIARRGPEHSILDQEADEDSPRVMYYLNDGVYSSFNCILFDRQIVSPFCLTVGKVLVDAPIQAPLVTSSLWGPTCDSVDCVLAKVKLPAGLKVGDWLGFRKMGAYTICAASTFNGFDRTKVVYTVGEEFAIDSLV